MTYNKEYIGERIQRKRNSLNITQEQLAEMINTSKIQYQMLKEVKIRQVLNLLLIFAMYLVKILIIIF